MTFRTAFLSSALFIAAAAGCYTGSAVDTNRAPDAPSANVDGTEPGSQQPGTTPVDGTPTGVPCEIAEFLKTQCSECHGGTPSGGAPNRLLTWDDLSAPSEGDPSTTVAQLALSRIQSTKRPMPPERRLAKSTVDMFAKWVADGLPKGTCNAPKPGEEPKQVEPGPDGGPDVAPSVCSSGVNAPPESFGTELMKPGNACIACHTKVLATGAGDPSRMQFELAGTVYKTLHEPNDCNGMAGTKVLIVDATGTTFTLPVNAAGNFKRYTQFQRPYTAMVIRGNKIRKMNTPQTDGDCNGCHTERGENGAPGRIMAP
jgi:mono/diheme cytochrome c family protein